MPKNSPETIAVVAALVAACSVSTSGLETPPAPQGGGATGGAGGPPPCPLNIPDRANWPGGYTATSCLQPCGPDRIGSRKCSQTDLPTCKASPGCVCQQGPCASCTDCVFEKLPSCYQPTNTAAPSDCAAWVASGVTCSPACARQLCLRADGKTGCVCNDEGRYACATWGASTWK